MPKLTYFDFLPVFAWFLGAISDGKIDEKDIDTLIPFIIPLMLSFSSDNQKVIDVMVKIARAFIAANPDGGEVH